MRRALLSVSDKAGVIDFARGLQELGVELVSTGGTARELSRAGIPPRPIEDFTGFPEIMDGRVKTLHPRLYGGLLARATTRTPPARRRGTGDRAGRPGVREPVPVRADRRPRRRLRAEIIENIDIGGPTMIRAAAKNSEFAAVVVDPDDYPAVLQSSATATDASPSRPAPSSPARRSPAPPATTRPSPVVLPNLSRRGLPAELERVLREGPRPPLRREPPPGRRLLRPRRRRPPPARRRQPAPRQGAVVQQPARPQLGQGTRRRLPGARLRDRQAQQPVRLRGRPTTPPRPTPVPSRATPRAPTAG